MYPYQDSSRPIEERVDDLLSRITLEEKAAQTDQYFSGLLTVDAEFRHEEERQDGHHRVEAEAFAGVGQRGGNQAFGLIFEHCI